MRPHAPGRCAYRMALYKVIRHRRTARTLRGDWSERDAPLRQAHAAPAVPDADAPRDAGAPAMGQPLTASAVE